MTSAPEVPRKDQLRIVVILGCSFARNLAYYRAWWGEEHQRYLSLANDHPIFWRAVNNNFLDMCVLDWCKLFADKGGKHSWRQIVPDAPRFEADMLRHLGLNAAIFKNEIEIMRRYETNSLHIRTWNILQCPQDSMLPRKQSGSTTPISSIMKPNLGICSGCLSTSKGIQLRSRRLEPFIERSNSEALQKRPVYGGILCKPTKTPAFT